MTKNDEIRELVKNAYRGALRATKSGKSSCCAPLSIEARSQEASTGCCGPAPSSAAATPAGMAAKVAGYGTELEEFAEAGASSFGCGNPLALEDVREGDTVLDLGSGAGFDLLIAAKKVGPTGRVIGIDMTEDMIAEASRNVEKAGFTNVEIRKGLIEELPVEDGSVDWVISNCVVNLSPEKDKVFAEIARVLKPGGRISISDLVAEDLPPELLELAAAYAACVGGAIAEKDYVAGLERAGLADVAIRERQLYDEAQIRALISSDAEWLGESLEQGSCELPSLDGKVASVRLTGRKPA